MNCTRCDGTGFLNLHQIPDSELYHLDSPEAIAEWMERNQDNDVQVCDCCGNGEDWYGTPGEHDEKENTTPSKAGRSSKSPPGSIRAKPNISAWDTKRQKPAWIILMISRRSVSGARSRGRTDRRGESHGKVLDGLQFYARRISNPQTQFQGCGKNRG
jgi:hypothetical protein